MSTVETSISLSPQQALARLKQGNLDFMQGHQTRSCPDAQQRLSFVESQHPFAIILGCSDARVPAEMVFNQGLGDLFVIRVAGNIVAASQLASIEFAIQEFNVPLVIVLGHSHCGAIHASLQALYQGEHQQSSDNLMSIVKRILPTLQMVTSDEIKYQPKKIERIAVKANVYAAVQHVRYGSTYLTDQVENEQLLVVGAQYHLETGEVEFYQF